MRIQKRFDKTQRVRHVRSYIAVRTICVHAGMQGRENYQAPVFGPQVFFNNIITRLFTV